MGVSSKPYSLIAEGRLAQAQQAGDGIGGSGDIPALNPEREEIRLLSFVDSATGEGEHAPGRDAEIVRCHLWHFSMREIKRNCDTVAGALRWEGEGLANLEATAQQPLQYLALSYTWGAPGNTRLIEVNGEQVPVTKNLEAALRALRRRRLMQQGYGLWVDALCIDQSNLAERSNEVGRMRDIYKSAKSVVIWLGEEGWDGGRAFELIRLLSKTFAQGKDECRTLAERIAADRSPIPKDSWAALAVLMQRPYWTRAWVLQEVAMGDRSMPILCGEHVVTWGQFYDAIYKFPNLHFDLVYLCINRECDELGLTRYGLRRNHVIQVNTQQKIQAGSSEAGMLPILDVVRQCLATNIRDKVYGVLGLMPTKVSQRIVPDYRKSVGEVYRTFAQAMIVGRRDLMILEECTWPPAFDNPSWVPDLTNFDHFRLFGGKPVYNAARDRPHDCTFSADGRTLRCEGVHVGTIDGIGATYFESDRRDDSHDRLHQTLSRKTPYSTEGDLASAVWQMLTGERGPRGEDSVAHYNSLLRCGLIEDDEITGNDDIWRGRATFNSLMRDNRHLEVGGRPLGSFFPAAAGAAPDPPESRDALERMFRFWRSRRPFVTSEGRLGAGTAAIRPGDHVFVIVGSGTPVVLRASGRFEHQIVGCCYLHEYMDGKAVLDIEDGLCELQKIDMV